MAKKDLTEGHQFATAKDKIKFISESLKLRVDEEENCGYALTDGSNVIMDDFRCFRNYLISLNNGEKIRETQDLSVEYRNSIAESIEERGSKEELYSYYHKALRAISEEKANYRERGRNELNGAQKQACFDYVDDIKAQECDFTTKFYEQVFDCE